METKETIAHCTSEEAEALDASLRLLAKFIASAIRRKEKTEFSLTKSKRCVKGKYVAHHT
jgi:hypothetical protein